jgi:hypothetical protein
VHKQAFNLVSANDSHANGFTREFGDYINIISCVLLNCDGDVNVYCLPRYEVIQLPTFYGIFYPAAQLPHAFEQNATPISARIKLPITLAKPQQY